MPTNERASRRFPLLLTTGRILSQYNVGAQTRRTANVAWHDEDLLEIHPHDAEERGIEDGDWVGIDEPRRRHGAARAGDGARAARRASTPRSTIRCRGANVITTDNSDWATNCPEYKVTAVQAGKVHAPSEWQRRRRAFEIGQHGLLAQAQARRGAPS